MCSSRGLTRTTGPADVSGVFFHSHLPRGATTVFLVQTGQLEDQLSVSDHIVVELPPRRGGGQTRARKRGERVEIQSVDNQADGVREEQQGEGSEEHHSR